MSLHLSDYHFELPEELIATHPTSGRDESRLMIVRRATGEIIHATFRDFSSLIAPEDLVVMNNAKVIPARFFSDDHRVEFLLLEKLAASKEWKCMVKPGRRMRLGAGVVVDGTRGEVTGILETGERLVRFDREPDLERIGSLALPPYMRRQMEDSDRERYQTVYASVPGSVAAPTAGLHFTPELVTTLDPVFLTLHVGAGTFRPVKEDDITAHRMHDERFEIEHQAAKRINAAKSIFAIGTTTVRVLEGCARDDEGKILPQQGATSIFIHPPKTIQFVSKLLTNFHLPGSTLLMLVSAFAGRELILEAYREAVEERYRFFSYGDCMALI